MVQKKRLIRLTQKLISIDSQNPPGDEYKIGRFVYDCLKRLGIKTKMYEFKKRRTNVVAMLEAKDDQRSLGSLLVTPHLDTVPAGKNWRFKPFSGLIRKNKIYGLGATDCKGNLASALEAIESMVEDKISLPYNLIFAATADEEAGSQVGLIPLIQKGILKPDAAVVLDSDEFDIIITQKGLLHLKIRMQGKRAHGAYPWRGINAIDTTMEILRDLKERIPEYPKDKYLRPPTLNIGTIRGGDKVNIVADWCECELDFRFLPGMSSQRILQRIRNLIKKHTKKYSIEIQALEKPYRINKAHPLVLSLSRAMKNCRIKSAIKGSEGATVITFFQDKHIPALATGFGSKGCAHTTDEYAKIENLYRGALVLEEFLKRFCF